MGATLMSQVMILVMSTSISSSTRMMADPGLRRYPTMTAVMRTASRLSLARACTTFWGMKLSNICDTTSAISTASRSA